MGCHDLIRPTHGSRLLKSRGMETGSHESSRRREAGASNTAATSATSAPTNTSLSRSARSFKRDCTSLLLLLGHLILSRLAISSFGQFCFLIVIHVKERLLIIIFSLVFFRPFCDPTLIALLFAFLCNPLFNLQIAALLRSCVLAYSTS